MPMLLDNSRKNIEIFKKYLEYDKEFAEELYTRFPILIINLINHFQKQPTDPMLCIHLNIDNCELWDFLDDNGFFVIRNISYVEVSLKYPVVIINPDPEPEPEIETEAACTTWATYITGCDTEPYKAVKISCDYPITATSNIIGTYDNVSVTTTYSNKPP